MLAIATKYNFDIKTSNFVSTILYQLIRYDEICNRFVRNRKSIYKLDREIKKTMKRGKIYEH